MPSFDYHPVLIAGIRGYLFHADGEEDGLAFVPEYVVLADGKLNRDAYLSDRWAYANNFANNFANPDAPGSHVWPDLSRPARGFPPGWEAFSARLARRIRGEA